MNVQSPTYLIFEPKLFKKLEFLSMLLGISRQDVVGLSVEALIPTLPPKQQEALKTFLLAYKPAATMMDLSSETLTYAEAAVLIGADRGRVAKNVFQKTFKRGPIVLGRPTVTTESVVNYLKRIGARDAKREERSK